MFVLLNDELINVTTDVEGFNKMYLFNSTYTDALMQMDSPVLVAVAGVAPLDVLTVDNDSKTFLDLRLQGSTVEKKSKRIF